MNRGESLPGQRCARGAHFVINPEAEVLLVDAPLPVAEEDVGALVAQVQDPGGRGIKQESPCCPRTGEATSPPAVEPGAGESPVGCGYEINVRVSLPDWVHHKMS